MKPALTETEWRRVLMGAPPAPLRNIRRSVHERSGSWEYAQAALYLHDQPFGFTRDMVEAIYTLLWFSGGRNGVCQRCLYEDARDGKEEVTMEGGNGIKGDPQCVVTCSVCGWFPRTDGWVRKHASQAAQAMNALLPPEEK